MSKIGTRVITTSSEFKELIGLSGTIIKEVIPKYKCSSLLGSVAYFRVKFDKPVHMNGEVIETFLFKETELKKKFEARVNKDLQRVLCLTARSGSEQVVPGKTYYIDKQSIYGDNDGDWYVDIYRYDTKAGYIGRLKLNHFQSIP